MPGLSSLCHCARIHWVCRSRKQDGPLLNTLMPPPQETAQQCTAREKCETQAKALSDEIDKQLYNDRDALASKETIHIVLLGSALPPSRLGASLAYFSCSQQAKARVVNPHF
jgi:hypothetical protein